MKTQLLTLAFAGMFAGAFAGSAMAQDAPKPQTTQAAQVDIKVSKSLAHSVKISGDSAMAIAKANADGGEVSSAELKMMDKQLVYNVKVLNKSKRATEVAIDAMSGEVVKNKQLGGLNAALTHRGENEKLAKAKRDSAMKAP
ncbi:MAG: PepSY domain-containing protein [bacterium]